jgi:two-component system invasion response regulator UvrY
VATAGTGEEVMAAVLENSADVLILDLGMPGGGIALVESVHALRPGLGILVYSEHAEREWAMRCLAAGASGYVSKSSDLSELTAGVTKVAAGRRHISAEVAEQLLERAIGVDEERTERPHDRLSSREFEVFVRLAAGAGTGEIAAELGLSSKTVSTYRSRILEKLGVERNADLTRYAIRHGLLEV